VTDFTSRQCASRVAEFPLKWQALAAPVLSAAQTLIQTLPQAPEMKHVLSALVVNQPGVLAHISGMLASRAFNIESLAVGETENPEFSRITFVVSGNDRVLDQVRKQLEKMVTVVRVIDFSGQEYVERDLMLMKVSTTIGKRSEIKELVDIFRGSLVDVSPEHVMIEISGQERKLEAFVDVMRPFNIIELVRTGRIALLRSNDETIDVSEDTPQEKAAAAARQ
jgi:acetolactate synthase I/III small subunit